MKRFIAIFLLLWTFPALSANEARNVGEGRAVPEDGFKNFAELQKWASTSSFGGGRVFQMRIDGTDVFCSDRMFTSGVPTSELTFFTKSHDGSIREFMLVPIQRKEHKIAVESDQIVVRCYNPAKKKWEEAMRMSSWMLPDSISKTAKGQQAGNGQPATRPESK